MDSFCPQQLCCDQQLLLSSPSGSCQNAEAPRLTPHCFAAISHFGIIFCHQTPEQEMGSALNLINAAFSSVPHVPSLSVPGPHHVTAAVPGAAAPTAAAPAPSAAQEEPKISSAPAHLHPGPALHSLVPLWNSGNDNAPVPTATGAGHSFQ